MGKGEASKGFDDMGGVVDGHVRGGAWLEVVSRDERADGNTASEEATATNVGSGPAGASIRDEEEKKGEGPKLTTFPLMTPSLL
jgi:hypothetical protein